MQDIRLLRKSLETKKIGVLELVTDLLREFEANHLGAVLCVNKEESFRQAEEAQKQIDAGISEPLLGIPCAHKDVFVTEKWRTTAGSKMLVDYLSPFDATVVKRIAESGAICLGKSSCDEFAMGSANQNCAFGPCLNPWDKKAIPGGSSGGSAALVGAGHVSFATGTDTGGSIRQPAAMCGVTGIKPTYGLVSRWGIIAYASSLDQAGPIAKSAYDCGLVLNAMVGFDPRDSTSQRTESVDYCALINAGNEKTGKKPLEDVVLGIPREYAKAIYSQDVATAFQESIRTYEKLGATVKEVSLPHANHSVAAYYVIAPAEASSNLSRFDGVKFGFRDSQAKTLDELYFDTRSEGFGEEVKRRILVGTFVLSHGYYDAYYNQASKVRRLILSDFKSAFEGCDFLLSPSSPVLAWDLDAQPDFGTNFNAPEGVPKEYLADLFTVGVSLAGLPAISVPCGFGGGQFARRPIGLQIIGPHFSEQRLLKVADIFQTETGWHTMKPSSPTKFEE